MNTSSRAYHSAHLVGALPTEFIGVETVDLMHDISCFMDLLVQLRTCDEPEPTRSYSEQYVEGFLDRAMSEVERRTTSTGVQSSRHTRLQRQRTKLDEMTALAQELKACLPIATYLDWYVPGPPMKPSGKNLLGHCPYLDHDDSEPSFIVFPNDSAWCFGCQRGGDLFRVIALVEGIPVFRDQLEFVASLVESVGWETPR